MQFSTHQHPGRSGAKSGDGLKHMACSGVEWTNRRGNVGVHVLMGGEDAGEWDIYPEEYASPGDCV